MTRILTTHVGSLPAAAGARRAGVRRGPRRAGRPRALRPAARRGGPRPRAPPGRGRASTVVSDGEMSKIGYATYIRHRLSGFEVGDVPRATPADLDAYPRYANRLARRGRERPLPAPDLPRPDHVRAPRAGRARPRLGWPAAIEGQPVAGAFMNAPSPGDHRAVPAQRVLPQPRRVPRGDRRGDEDRVRGDRRRRVHAPDRRARPGDGPPHHVPRPTRRGVRGGRRPARRGDQPRAARRPGRPGPPAPLLGQLRGPAPPRHRRWRRSSTWCCGPSPSTILFEAANPRHEHEWAVWREAAIPDDKMLAPGVIDSTCNYIEHPELVAQRTCTLRRDRRPRARHGRRPTAASAPGRASARSIPTSAGRSSARSPRAPGARASGRWRADVTRHVPSGPVTTSRRGSFWITSPTESTGRSAPSCAARCTSNGRPRPIRRARYPRGCSSTAAGDRAPTT